MFDIYLAINNTVNAALITNCARRKASASGDHIGLGDAFGSTVKELAFNWATLVAKSSSAGPAKDIYQGRSITEASIAASHLDHGLRIVSAGLGLVSADDPIPNYDATITGRQENSVSTVLGENVRPVAWWQELNRALGKPRPILRLLTELTDSLVVIAISGAYLELIQAELLEAVSDKCDRFLIITGASRTECPTTLQSYCLPYDSRFDGPDSPLPGTRSDFAQRAARHFVEAIYLNDPHATHEVYKRRVSDLMNSMRPWIRKAGRKCTDKQIINLIDQYWDVVDGRSSEMLRFFRDYLGIACEQSRFARLFHEAKRIRHPQLEI